MEFTSILGFNSIEPPGYVSRLKFAYLEDVSAELVFTGPGYAADHQIKYFFPVEILERCIDRLKAEQPEADITELQRGLNAYNDLFEGPLVEAQKIVFKDNPYRASAENLLTLKIKEIEDKEAVEMYSKDGHVTVVLTEQQLRDTIAAAREEGYELPRFQQALHEIERHKPTPLPLKFAKLATQVAVVGVAITNGLGIAVVALDNRLTESSYQPDKLRADPSNPQLLVDQESRRVLSGLLPQQAGQSVEVVDLKSQTVTQITRQDGTQPMFDHTDAAWRYVLFGLVNQMDYRYQTISQLPESSQKVAAAMASFNRVSGNGGSTDVTELNKALQTKWQAQNNLAKMMPY